MAKGKNSKKKKEVIEDVEEVISDVVEEITAETKFVDNSFAECIASITRIPSELFGDIHANIDRVGVEEWHKPYIEVLKHHGYDMIFFEYNPAEPIGGDKKLENIMFERLPTGKCIMMGRDSVHNFKSVTPIINDKHLAKVVFDPAPNASFVELSHVGFFIRTFMESSTEADGS
jgi:hypothetical protein